jgi:hypothetical protein
METNAPVAYDHPKDAKVDGAAETRDDSTMTHVPDGDPVLHAATGRAVETATIGTGREDELVPEAVRDEDWVGYETDGGEDRVDDWDLPPIPDADDVLREYMENYQAERTAELHDDDNDDDDSPKEVESQEIPGDSTSASSANGEDGHPEASPDPP